MTVDVIYCIMTQCSLVRLPTLEKVPPQSDYIITLPTEPQNKYSLLLKPQIIHMAEGFIFSLLEIKDKYKIFSTE